MRFALFTSPEDFVDELDLIESIFSVGAESLYVDKPQKNELSLERYLLSIPESIRQRTFLCGSPNAAAEFGLAGFHRPSGWFVDNADAVCRFSGRMSVEANSAGELEKIPSAVRERISRAVVPSASGIAPAAGMETFFACDATDGLPREGDLAIVSGIWEFADPVSAWRRLCNR